MAGELTQRLRSLSPPSVRRSLGAVRAYLHRLQIWRDVNISIRGATPADSQVLRSAALAAPIRSLSDLGVWQNPEVSKDILVDVMDVGRFNVRARSDDLYHVLPNRERAIYRAVIEMLGPGDVFVDAGANIGFYTVLASRQVGPSGRVIAVEMIPDTAAALHSHVEINGLNNVQVIQAALSDVPGQRLSACVKEGHFGMASVARLVGGRTVVVETTTLDAILADVPRVRLMKMDLEGAEASALSGAGKVLSKVDACILEERSEGVELSALMRPHGFTLRRLDRANLLAVR